MKKDIDYLLLKASKKLIDDKVISRWKIINKPEKILSAAADKSILFKIIYVLFYGLLDRKYYKKSLSLVDQEIKIFKPNKNPIEQFWYQIDMIYSLHRFGAMFHEYFLFDFANLNSNGRSKFITDKLRYAYCEVLNDRGKIQCFDNKEITYKIFKKYFEREVIFVSNPSDFNLFQSILNRHEAVIKKPTIGSCGRGIELISTNDFDSIQSAFNHVLKSGDCVIEEVVSNHSAIRKIYPGALSTVRIPTIITNGEVHVFYPVVRFGQKGKIVDNAGSGGMVANIDLSSGVVTSPARDKNGNYYLFHPDTGQKIIGFQIPLWNHAIELSKKLAKIIPEVKYVGWDLALTENGWIMIEGNARGELYLMQIADRTGKKEELDRIILNEIS